MAKKVASRKKAAPKKAAKKKAAPASGATTLAPAKGEVIVRMYRHGLGDCFLLAFGTANAKAPRYVLVDCGVHSRQDDGPARLAQVMQNLRTAVGGHLHVVAATHEHADHLSGFVQKGSPFRAGDFTIDQLWLSWTEKRGDKQADRLRAKHGVAKAILDAAVKRARKGEASLTRPANAPLALSDRMLLGADFEEPAAEAFDEQDAKAVLARIKALGKEKADRAETYRALVKPPPAAGMLGASAGPKTEPSSNELAVGLLSMLAKETPTYASPGKTLDIPGVDGARAYVLGPPRDEKLLKKDLPSKVRGGGDHEYQETYLSADAAMATFAQSPALAGAGSGGGSILSSDITYPFAYYVRDALAHEIDDLTTKSAKPSPTAGAAWSDSKPIPPSVQQFFDEHYAYEDWRKIDGDWLALGEQLALNLDSDTNNTSLVLAFELGEPGKGRVLLFPGDAQVGNWLSWRDQPYGNGGAACSADDLLRRTVLYKVGHHGSHNATLKCDPRDASVPDGVPYGLELMDDVIAMVPVDRAAADKKMPTPWRMPHKPLYERLREKARRRVLRCDLSLKPLAATDAPDLAPPDTKWSAAPGLRGVSWRRSAEEFGAGTKGPLYYEIRIAATK